MAKLIVAAVYEGVKIESSVVPSWDRRGGCASRKYCEATFESADGVVILD